MPKFETFQKMVLLDVIFSIEFYKWLFYRSMRVFHARVKMKQS